jgi:hypothetical protein
MRVTLATSPGRSSQESVRIWRFSLFTFDSPKIVTQIIAEIIVCLAYKY